MVFSTLQTFSEFLNWVESLSSAVLVEHVQSVLTENECFKVVVARKMNDMFVHLLYYDRLLHVERYDLQTSHLKIAQY